MRVESWRGRRRRLWRRRPVGRGARRAKWTVGARESGEFFTGKLRKIGGVRFKLPLVRVLPLRDCACALAWLYFILPAVVAPLARCSSTRRGSHTLRTDQTQHKAGRPTLDRTSGGPPAHLGAAWAHSGVAFAAGRPASPRLAPSTHDCWLNAFIIALSDHCRRRHDDDDDDEARSL
jgi:hypothetical protein